MVARAKSPAPRSNPSNDSASTSTTTAQPAIFSSSTKDELDELDALTSGLTTTTSTSTTATKKATIESPYRTIPSDLWDDMPADDATASGGGKPIQYSLLPASIQQPQSSADATLSAFLNKRTESTTAKLPSSSASSSTSSTTTSSTGVDAGGGGTSGVATATDGDEFRLSLLERSSAALIDSVNASDDARTHRDANDVVADLWTAHVRDLFCCFIVLGYV
jgi:hypothetical protein